jgi:hypothetical protein
VRLHPEEMELAQAYWRSLEFEPLAPEQIKRLGEQGKDLREWLRTHQALHNLINAAVFLFLFLADYWVLLKMPRWLLAPGEAHSNGRLALAGFLAGSLHSILFYSLGVYSMHEGAAHKSIFAGRGRIASVANFLASNICRLAACDPNHYAKHHMSHHSRFGTAADGEFLNFVRPRRLWLTLLPLGALTNFNDFLAHRAEKYTRSRIVSALLTIGFHGTYAVLTYRAFGGLFTLVAFGICFPHVGFYLDRLRQFTEHNLMPLDNTNGSRSLGCGFWGLLIGGGPWGSPCHWEHHLVSGIPWYQQLIVHFKLTRMLTPQQREQFLIEPVIGFPKLWWRLVRDLYEFERRCEPAQTRASAR